MQNATNTVVDTANKVADTTRDIANRWKNAVTNTYDNIANWVKNFDIKDTARKKCRSSSSW